MNTKINSTTDIMKNALKSVKVRLAWVMHILAGVKHGYWKPPGCGKEWDQ